MGMGNYAVSSFVIGYDDLKKICPKEIHAVEEEIYFDVIGWGLIGQWLSWDDPDQLKDNVIDSIDNEDFDECEKISEEIVSIYDKHITKLKDAFHKNTGLTLYFDYYNAEDGDRYDMPNDKDGCIFCVDGMVVLSPAGEKYKDIISERRWTQFG